MADLDLSGACWTKHKKGSLTLLLLGKDTFYHCESIHTYHVAEPSGYRAKPVDQNRQQGLRDNCPNKYSVINPTNFNHTMREKQNWVPKAGKV